MGLHGLLNAKTCVIIYQMVTALQTDRRQSTEEALAALAERQDRERQAVTAPEAAIEPIDISALTDDDLRKMGRESLVMMIHANKGDLKALGAVRELFDRIDGKPLQRIEQPPQQGSTTNIYGLPQEVMERILRQQLERMERQKLQMIEHKA